MLDGTCARCGMAFVRPARAHNKRFCSRRCGDAARDGFSAWRCCPRCGLVLAVNGQAVRKGFVEVRHLCRRHERDKEPICLRCVSLRGPGHRHRYDPVQPHGIVCVQCGEPFVGKWTRKCPSCVTANHREGKRRQKRRRRALVASVASEPYSTSAVFRRDGWRCHICGRLTARERQVPDPRAPTIDHIIPLADGGDDTMRNVATAHFSCNSRRGTGGLVQMRLIA